MRAYLARDHEPGLPSHANAHWRLGMVLEKRNRPDDARSAFETSLALDPDHKEARTRLRRLGD